MIQRIQTLYLLGVAVFTTLVATLPLARFSAGLNEMCLKSFGIVQTATAEDIVAAATDDYIPVKETIGLAATPFLSIVVVLALAVAVVTIFLYKRRLLQIRLCAVEIVLQLGVAAFIFFYIARMTKVVSEFDIHGSYFTAVVAFPFISMILSYLALRAIVRDEAMVRSLDRIR